MTPPSPPTTTLPEPAYRSARTKPACCACKHQRRRCSTECPLAAYFPPEKNTEFRNVHKLFGIHNVVNLLKKIAPNYRDDAVKSLVYEANLRASHPVGGCCAVIQELTRQIIQCTDELERVNKCLSLYKYDGQGTDPDQDWEKMFFRNSGEGSGGSIF